MLHATSGSIEISTRLLMMLVGPVGLPVGVGCVSQGRRGARWVGIVVVGIGVVGREVWLGRGVVWEWYLYGKARR